MKKKTYTFKYWKLTCVLMISHCWMGNNVFSQSKDSLGTGYLADAAEEYWPAHDSSADVYTRLDHLPIRQGKGVVSIGGSLREVFEYYNNYQWGIGPQDKNGYFLHRVLVHSNFQYNRHFRLFAELQSSFLTGRNGGARPVQDLNKMAFTELFAEYATETDDKTVLKLRIGEQALHYGVGSLLDIRDANVHRSFAGAKFIIEKGSSKLDVFAMELMRTSPGLFDDQIDASQKIAGAWFTHNYHRKWLRKVDLYYLFTHRDAAAFTQGNGAERRHTMGTGITFDKNGWTAYTEADLQLGSFNNDRITAWKLTQTLGYQFSGLRLKPNLSLQSAISSGDKTATDPHLQTFNPIYPKAIYYGFIDNAGAANLFLVHLKAGIQPFKKLSINSSYYWFWRQSVGDGIYGPGGGYFLPAANRERSVGQMIDLVTGYQYNDKLRFTAITTYYKRGAFLKAMPATGHDIFYTGISAILHF